ncbi:metallophosphoesterase [Pajaroellobacter abortibovis]|uniref:Calcineurin-like phosphoesterase domain-containing protein n=1 Tax=Pajaroellobacter abortibovis TaxID=1882918 RepID=A0A1L6MYA8_9BACT|nr:metallophosphoesterase [Pajaroellobacter abortibovis]APS00492.1 hypothetical protein BCY86_07240 [Pajaroellobacter abortibovis]
MNRTIVVGDVHGCRKELEALLEQVAFTSSDKLVFVGDLIARGPDSRGVLQVARQVEAVVVRGNHEAKLLAWRSHSPENRSSPLIQLSPMHLAIAQELTEADWALLESTSLWHNLPEHELLIVHAGLLPGLPVEQQEPWTLLHIRGLTPQGTPCAEKQNQRWWGAAYQGPPHVVFGHNAFSEPQIHAWATGIDTGCVYGGKLTALVLSQGEKLPRGEQVKELLISYTAAQAYCPRRGLRP